jgi:HSP20 family protein
VELVEDDREFELQVAVPGFQSKDVRVAVLPDAVIVEGTSVHHHDPGDSRVCVCEFGERKVFRRVSFPEPVDIERVSATLDNGLLTVRAEKKNRKRATGATA